MIRTLVILFLFVFQQNAFSQAGIYRTFDDLINGNLIAHEGDVSVIHALGNFRIAFKEKGGKKIKYSLNKEQIWGYQNKEGYIFRVSHKKDPYMILEVGNIIYYTNYSTKVSDDGMIQFNSNQFVPHISHGLNGDMVKLTKKNLKKMLNEDGATQKELDGLKKKRSYQAMYDYIVEYNAKHNPQEEKVESDEKN